MTAIVSFLDQPLFGITLTISVFFFFVQLFRKAKSPLLNPLIFSIAAIIAFLSLAKIPYASYAQGASLLSFFMGPSIVALAIPLYRQFDKLKKNALPVLLGISVGVLASILSGVLLSMLLGLSRELLVSIAPKGATSAVSMVLSKNLGGDPAMTAMFVIVAGMFGYVMGERLLSLVRIKQPVARGISLGTGAHILGTVRAFELGEVEGVMSSLAIGLAGVITSIFFPLILTMFGI
jgi:predicted murein hydrolase (TIGR00659 family)